MPFRNAYYVILICKSHCTLSYRPVNLATIITVRPYSLFQNMGPFHNSVWLRWNFFKSFYKIICMTLCRWLGNILMSKVLVSLLPRFTSYYHVFRQCSVFQWTMAGGHTTDNISLVLSDQRIGYSWSRFNRCKRWLQKLWRWKFLPKSRSSFFSKMFLFSSVHNKCSQKIVLIRSWFSEKWKWCSA